MRLMFGVSFLAGLIVLGFTVAVYFSIPGTSYAKGCPRGTVAASWYGAESGRKTATGAFFNGQQWLVAHRTLAFGTKLRLTYKGRTVIVPVGDRGPYLPGRVLDLSEAVARALGTKAAGVACVVMERL